MSLTDLSDKQLLRLWRRLVTKTCDRLGVSSFDMPTLNVLIPSMCVTLRAVKAEGARRKRINPRLGERYEG